MAPDRPLLRRKQAEKSQIKEVTEESADQGGELTRTFFLRKLYEMGTTEVIK